MLRGSYTVRVDEKGRIKLPAAYRRYIDKHYGAEFYVTSVTGDATRLYPMPEWLAIEEKLQACGTMDSAVKKFLDRTNYYGQLADMDLQGRILVHPLLRSSTQLSGDVVVLGYLRFLEVWNLEYFRAILDREPHSAADFESLAELGI